MRIFNVFATSVIMNLLPDMPKSLSSRDPLAVVAPQGLLDTQKTASLLEFSTLYPSSMGVKRRKAANFIILLTLPAIIPLSKKYEC